MTNKTAAEPIIPAADLGTQAQSLFHVSYAWMHTHWLQIIIAGAIGTGIFLALHAGRKLGDRLCRDSASPAGWGTVFGRAISRTGNFFMLMVAIKLVAGYAGAPAQVATTITFLFTIAAVFQAAIWAREIILGAIEHRTMSENYSGEALGSAMGIIRLLVTFALFAIALIVVLDNLGVNVTGLVAGLGVGGIAIGLAAKGIFDDLFAALAIIFDRPFRRGDAITFGSSAGSVEAIGLKSTRIRATNGEELIIANKNLLDKEIMNNTRRNYRRIKFTLGLVQWTPVEVMDRVHDILKEEIERCGLKFVRAGFFQFGASSYDFDVEFDSENAAFQDFFDARHTVGLAIIRRFNAEGIEFAYPTQTAFTAAPDGRMILPYESHAPAQPERPRNDGPPPAPREKSTDRSAVDG
ncbi:mechanosensitive ion channel protein MscS [Sphingomonas sp. Leaf357]|uniref:mechanosensitive ion channel family protein n=1 Tax=Sphingomonas sp. Leaf357 TaxID=1736350 RepID=UPI0006FAF9CC|nr:mechanosensitive ion channel family protein [Sphingomonas sp. Leaf357]KQS01787.1 mechanosensitive ion channel protein MscS [Sphingomonas sp. Leaf357]